MQSAQIQLRPQGPYSLGESARFLEGFAPAAHEGADAEGHLHLAFCVEGDWAPVGVCLREEASAVTAEIWGPADPNAVGAQLARILSLDVEASEFTAVAERDPVVGQTPPRPAAGLLLLALRGGRLDAHQPPPANRAGRQPQGTDGP